MNTFSLRLAALLLLVGLFQACTETEAATEVIVAVHSDLNVGEELDTLEVRVLERDELDDEEPPARTYSLALEPKQGQHNLPLSFSIAPKQSDSRGDFRVIVSGLRGGEVVVEQQAIASFVPHKSLVLSLFLARSCLDRLCRDEGGGRTENACNRVSGSCQRVEVSTKLPTWSGNGSELKGGDDAGGSDEPDAGESDAESLDGAVDDADARSDATVQPEASADGGDTDAGADAMSDALVSCMPGTEPVGGNCQNIDECANATLHDCDTDPPACVDRAAEQGRFACVCPTGYAGSGKGANGCEDQNECELTPAACDMDPVATCSNAKGSFSCTCPSGFAGDGKGAQGCLPVLGNLSVASAALSPAFDPLVTEYTTRVALWRNTAVVSAGVQVGQQLSIDDSPVTSNQNVQRSLALGDTQVQVKVSVGGNERTYTIKITRGAPVEHYVKASNTGGMDFFGFSVALSADGSTMAVGAPQEDSSSTGINSTPNDDAAQAGAVYVFRRSGASWVQEAYIKPNIIHADDEFGHAVALTANGSTLAVGAWSEDSASTGINSTPNTAALDAGAVYVFRRSSAGTWTQEAYLKSDAPSAGDFFGSALVFNPDGRILAIGAPGESTGPGPTTPNEDAPAAGAVYTFYNEGPGWLPYQFLKAQAPAEISYFGNSLAMSVDGSALIIGSQADWTSKGGLHPTPDRLAPFAGAVYVYRREGCCVYKHEELLKAGLPSEDDRFGYSVAVNGDGTVVVVGALAEDSSTTTVNSTPDELTKDAGAAYVFRRTAGTWAQEAYLKPLNPSPGDNFGEGVAVSSDGTLIAVGAPNEATSGSGVNATPNDAAARAGAVYLFRITSNVWSQETMLKAFNPGVSNIFGYCVAMSPSGATLVVGSTAEASSTTGVGTAPDRAAVGAGAVYVYQ